MEPAAGISERLVERLSRARSMTVLTGAGVSHESGVPTFRGEDGLWGKYTAEELATWQAFEANPELVWRWYDYRRQVIADVEPNPAHHAVARLEPAYDNFVLVTQNVDGLHSRAGSTSPVELHGNIWRARCTRERTTMDLPENPLREVPPRCPRCNSLLRPDVVWFGEPLPSEAYERADGAACSCEAMLVVGTSAMVRPAASLPLVAKHNGALVVEVNVGLTPISALIDATLFGKAGEVLPELVDRVLERKASQGSPSMPSSEKAETASR
ncbi:MAG: NAD-dependent deacylase [Candidatus Eisenbacteria bacterium]